MSQVKLYEYTPDLITNLEREGQRVVILGSVRSDTIISYAERVR